MQLSVSDELTVAVKEVKFGHMQPSTKDVVATKTLNFGHACQLTLLLRTH